MLLFYPSYLVIQKWIKFSIKQIKKKSVGSMFV